MDLPQRSGMDQLPDEELEEYDPEEDDDDEILEEHIVQPIQFHPGPEYLNLDPEIAYNTTCAMNTRVRFKDSQVSIYKQRVQLYRNALQDYEFLKALRILEDLTQAVLENPKLESHFCSILSRTHQYFIVDLKYEDQIRTQAARLLSDTTLFFIYNSLRRLTRTKCFPSGRTLLTPHRRRQLLKTLNAEHCIYVQGSNSEFILGVAEPRDSFLELAHRLILPAVYSMKTSGRHTVFWCHDNKFYGCGLTRNLSIRAKTTYTHYPTELDFRPRLSEVITGFRCLDYGTLFETDQRWYFVGDYYESQSYLSTLYNQKFESIDGENLSPNLWVCHSRPKQSIMNDRLEDERNLVSLRFLSTNIMIRVYPSYWTEALPGFRKRRNVIYLLNGVELQDVHIENIRSGIVWLSYLGLLYHGEMKLIKNHREDPMHDLDYYSLLIDLEECRIPGGSFVTGLTCFDDSVLFKTGDFPCIGFDHLGLLEDRSRGNVQKFMFEKMEKYMMSIPFVKEYTLKDVVNQAKLIIESGQLDGPLELDPLNRLQNSHYANYFGFLAYGAFGRQSFRPSKFYELIIDHFTVCNNPLIKAKNRMKQLFEEFERVNFPGTDVWKPTEFLKDQPEPENDTMTEGEYRAAAVTWCMDKFLETAVIDSAANHFFLSPTDRLMVQYIMHTLLYAHELWRVHTNQATEESKKLIADIEEEFRPRVDDTSRMLRCMDPGAILELRIAEGYRIPEDFDMEREVTMRFRMRHLDPTLEDTLFEVKTFETLIRGRNKHFVEFIDSDDVLDLNKAYPNDFRLHRLIAQTHFIGHGLTDLEGAANYERTFLRKVGWYFVRSQSYLENNRLKSRGYLSAIFKNFDLYVLASRNQLPGLTFVVTCSCGSVIYCHPILPNLYSLCPIDTPLPPTLPEEEMIVALHSLCDSRLIASQTMEVKVRILDWYNTAHMPEAFVDLLKMCIMDARPAHYKLIRTLLTEYPDMTQRMIAEYRPGILLWSKSPIPKPRIEHIKIITEMWPKNDFERITRIPRKHYYVNGEKKNSAFHEVGTREMKIHYEDGEERDRPLLEQYYRKDFPLHPDDPETDTDDDYDDDDDDETPIPKDKLNLHGLNPDEFSADAILAKRQVTQAIKRDHREFQRMMRAEYGEPARMDAENERRRQASEEYSLTE